MFLIITDYYKKAQILRQAIRETDDFKIKEELEKQYEKVQEKIRNSIVGLSF
jgi:hypothetical protein